MDDDEYEFVDESEPEYEAAPASSGEIASEGGPEEYYQTFGGDAEGPSEPGPAPSPLTASAPAESPPSALEQQLPAGLGEGSPQFGVTPDLINQQLDYSRFRTIAEEADPRSEKRLYEEQASKGEFSAQDSARLQRMNWGRSHVEKEVDAGRMTHRDGLRALQQIDNVSEPLMQRRQMAEAKAKNQQYETAMKDSKFREMIEDQNEELRAKDVRRHLTRTPDGGFVYTGKGKYVAPQKDEFDPVKALGRAKALAEATIDASPDDLEYKAKLQTKTQEIFQRLRDKPKFEDVPADQFMRQRGVEPPRPQVGGSFDDLSGGAAPNPNPQQASNEYAAIQKAYPGGASTIKDPRLVQRVIQLRRIMGK